ncbi:MAG: (2Fe-2S) ferredoxin domain-containing protein [Alphaproteobacteria bacterium]|nr:(2Fe-2S) ferredoxin domain-containing protein [Alphaproteobacteria bacterium]
MFFTHHIFCCNNRREPGHTRGCCAEKEAEVLRDYMKLRLKEMGVPKARVNQSGCLDRCELGPCIVIYPEGVWYAPKTREDIDTILREHIIGGKAVEALRLPD